MLARLSSIASRQPLLFGAATATVKTTAADVLVQTTIEGRRFSELDTKRTAVFTIFGGAWMGVGQYLLYCRLFEAMVPGTTAIASVQKACLDQLCHVPLLYGSWTDRLCIKFLRHLARHEAGDEPAAVAAFDPQRIALPAIQSRL